MDNLFLKSYIQQQQQQHQQAQSSQPQHHHLYHHLHQSTNENSFQTPMPNMPSQSYGYHTTQYTNMPQSFFNHQQQTNPNYFYVNQLNAPSHPSHQQFQSYTYQTIYPPTSNDVPSANQNHLSMYNPTNTNSHIKFNKPNVESSTSTLTSSSSVSNNESIADVTNIPKYTKPKINQKLSDERAFLPPPPPRLPPPPPPSTSSMHSGLLPTPYQHPPPPTYEFITR